MTGEPDFARLHVDTTLRYSTVPVGTVEPCPSHPYYAAIQVTSKTRKWTGEEGAPARLNKRTFPVTIQEHPPVCSVCFEPLPIKEEDDRSR